MRETRAGAYRKAVTEYSTLYGAVPRLGIQQFQSHRATKVCSEMMPGTVSPDGRFASLSRSLPALSCPLVVIPDLSLLMTVYQALLNIAISRWYEYCLPFAQAQNAQLPTLEVYPDGVKRRRNQ
jgi:hypothetical protein